MKRRMLRTFLTLFLLFVMAWTLLNKFRIEQYMTGQIENIITVSRLRDAYASGIVLRNIQEVGADLRLIRDSYEMKTYLEDPVNDNFRNLESLLLRLMENKEYLNRMTFTGADGMEEIRVERRSTPQLVPSDQLVDRSGDDFFKKSVRMQGDQLYLESGTKKNNQNNEVLIQFAIPVFSRDGALDGVLSMSCSTSYLMQLMKADRISNGIQNEIFYVVNESGSFLLNPTEIKDHTGRNAKASAGTKPTDGIFRNLEKNSFCYEKSGNLLYLYYDVLSESKSSISGFQNQTWAAVHIIDLSKIYTFSMVARGVKLGYSSIVFVVLMVLLFSLMILRGKLQKKDSQLNMSRQITQSSADAVMVTEKDKRITDSNAACEIKSWYTGNEIQGCGPGVYKSAGNQLMQSVETLIELMEDSLKYKAGSYLIMNIIVENYNQILAQIGIPDLDISSIFLSMFRDSIKDRDIAVQIGRNHFLVILSVNEGDTGMERMADVFLEQITKNVHYANTDFYFKVRIGCTGWQNEQNNLQQFYLNSMLALEWAQKNGIEGVLFYHENFTRHLMQEAEIENLLKNAIPNQELHLVYQPQMDARTETIVGAEALIRWENPVLGNISPSIFIPIAEKSGMIIAIGNWVLDQVCRDFSLKKTEAFMADDNFHCAVNVSAIQMEDEKFFDNFIATIKKHRISCRRIEIEVTESAFIANMDDRWDLLKKLQQNGISIAIDDFGTGYSSLSYLNHLPIDIIKIDRSFIRGYPEHDEGKLMEILVYMAKRLGKTVLAEGVETMQQLEYLNMLECDQIQGFIYSRPLEIQDFYDLYIRNRR